MSVNVQLKQCQHQPHPAATASNQALAFLPRPGPCFPTNITYQLYAGFQRHLTRMYSFSFQSLN